MREMRIRGVKTNIPFRSMLNHPTFISGKCYTTFIEETPELFQLEQSQDRATKDHRIFGDRIVNSITVQKAFSKTGCFQKYDKEAPCLRRQR